MSDYFKNLKNWQSKHLELRKSLDDIPELALLSESMLWREWYGEATRPLPQHRSVAQDVAMGQVVMVLYPCSNQVETLLRPAVIVDYAGDEDWLLCQITTESHDDNRKFWILDDQAEDYTGVEFPRGYARPQKVFTAPASLLVGRICELRPIRSSEIHDEFCANILSCRALADDTQSPRPAPGWVVMVPFPFSIPGTTGTSYPALVCGRTIHGDCICLPITQARAAPTDMEIAETDLTSGSLRSVGYVRSQKLFMVPARMLGGQVGELKTGVFDQFRSNWWKSWSIVRFD